MLRIFRRLLVQLLVVSTATFGVPGPASAGMIGTDAALHGDRQVLASALERADVRAELGRYGVDPAELKARIAALSDEEAASLAGRIGSLPAGGDAGVGSIVGALLFVFLVLLITDLLGLTKVFPFTRSVR